jgi:hypothetical protein
MKMKFGAFVVAGSGKIGGHVASRNRSGAFLRTKVTPTNPQTGAQNAVRSLLASLSSAWRSLTGAQRAAWNGAVSAFPRTNVFGDIVNDGSYRRKLARCCAAVLRCRAECCALRTCDWHDPARKRIKLNF